MKRILFAALAAALAGAACSTLQVSTDYDKSVDFTQYKTFSWHDTGDIKDDILAKRLENALSDTLAAKGLKRVETGGDVWLVAHARLSKQTQINTYNSGLGLRLRLARRHGDADLQRLRDSLSGTLVVDLVDGAKKDMVWRGIASDTLNPQASSGGPREKAAGRRAAALPELPARQEVRSGRTS